MVAELSWPIARTEGENKESHHRTFLFPISVQRSHNDFLRPMKHDLAASDEVATWKAWELARICFHSSLYDTLGQTEP